MAFLSEEVQTDLLMKEYTALRGEVLYHFREAKLPAKFLQIFIAGFAVIGYYIIFNINPEQISHALNVTISSRLLFICFLILANVISYYFVFDILDSYYCIFTVVARIINIEEQINSRSGKPLMVLESKF